MEVIEIQQKAEYFKNDLYGQVRTEQTQDQEFYEDSFPVPEVVKPHKPLRSGLARKIVDNPAEQMITRNPQVFINTGNREADNRLSKVLNSWMQVLKRQNPNPFKESVKNPLLRGETYLYLCHDDGILYNDYKCTLPVRFIVPDPMTVYASFEEDENGMPLEVFVMCDRLVSDIKMTYPDWSNPNDSKKTKWLAYWNKDVRYFEAGGVPVLEDGVQKNEYGFAPFIRRYSGFGRRDANSNLESLIVSELRGSRGLLKEECLVRSDIASALHLYAHPRQTLIIPQDGTIEAEKLKDSYSFEPGTLSVLPLPTGSQFDKNNQLTPVPEVFNHLAEINARIMHRHPMAGAGSVVTTSGRQDDILGATVMHRYETIIENTETMFATAVEKALQICHIVDFVPEGLKQEDLEKNYKCELKLRAEDSIERDRMITLGDRLWAQGNGSIDIETYHTQYLGYTQEQSKDIQAKMLADKVTLNNPDVAQVMGMVFAEESGMGKWLEEAKMANAIDKNQQTALSEAPPPSGMQRMKGETMTESGFEMIDTSLANRGARRPPARYTRG